MRQLSANARNSVSLQAEMFRLAEKEHGLSTAVLSRTRSIPKSTLDGWASGETQMPAWALGELRLPDDITTIILTPWEKYVGTCEPGSGCLDELGREAAGFVHEKLDREADGVVCHIDKAVLKGRARRIASTARAAAA